MNPKVMSKDLQPLFALRNVTAHDSTIRRKQILYKKDMDYSEQKPSQKTFVQGLRLFYWIMTFGLYQERHLTGILQELATKWGP